MIDILSFKGFYPMLFTTIGIISLALIFAVKAILIKFKDTDSKNFLFKTHVEEHTDTTSKMENMHTKVVDGIPEVYHQELHSLEVSVKSLTDITVEINQKLDILMAQMIKTRKVIDINSKKHK